MATWGLLIAVASLVVEHGLQARGLQQLWLEASRAQAQQLWHTGLVAPQHVGSSQTRARTYVSCIGRRILNHCVTREALHFFFKERFISFPVNIFFLSVAHFSLGLFFFPYWFVGALTILRKVVWGVSCSPPSPGLSFVF